MGAVASGSVGDRAALGAAPPLGIGWSLFVVEEMPAAAEDAGEGRSEPAGEE